jgi:hypothetical protein
LKKNETKESPSPSKLIDARIKELGDWRGEMLGKLRALVKEADPEVVETWKWRGVPVWEHDGILCTGETYKTVVKMTFAKGAALEDPAKLFNSSLEGNIRRAMDFAEGAKINGAALHGEGQEAEEIAATALTLPSDERLERSCRESWSGTRPPRHRLFQRTACSRDKADPVRPCAARRSNIPCRFRHHSNWL